MKRAKQGKITCVIDPSFIIAWSRYRYGSKLSEVVDRCYILEEFYDLFSNEKTIGFLRLMLESKVFVIYNSPYDTYKDTMAMILDISVEDNRVCQMSTLIAKLLAISIDEGIPFLTDNYCVHKFARIYLDKSQVWSSYDLIRYMVDLGALNNLEEALKAFSEDTGTVFRKIEIS